MSWLKELGATITKPAVVVAAALSSPIDFYENPKETVQQFIEQPITTQVAEGALVGAGLGALAGGVAGVTSLAKAAASKLGVIAGIGATAAIVAPKTTEIVATNPNLRDVAIGTAVGGPLLGGVVALEKGASIITTAAETYGPEIKTALEVAGVTTGIAALAAGGMYVASKLGSDKTTQKELSIGKEGVTEPITPETTTITTGAKKRYKRRTAQKPTQMIQRVTVNVNNKKYLNKGVFVR